MNCILYLVDTNDLSNFRRSLDSIPGHLRKYPIIAYHEASLGHEVRSELKQAHPQLEFYEIVLAKPKYSDEIDSKIPEHFVMDICSFGMGYRSMCRFFSGEVFNRPELQKYEYVLRLDTDSAIIDMDFDPFDVMVANDADYGYRLLCNDHPQCYVNYYSSFKSVVESMGFSYRLQKDEEGFVYYTNFEVMRLSTFRSQLYRDVYEGLDKTGGFYLHRWGDHIHRYAFINQFGLNAQQMIFGYRHSDSTFVDERELFCFGRA